MNSLDAAYHVLKNAETPLSIKTILEAVIEQGLWLPEGKTPEATLGAALYTDVKNKGLSSRFTKTAPSTFAINQEYAPKTQEEEAPKEITPLNTPDIATLSFTDAAEYVLHNCAGKQPMHYYAITNKALEMKLLNTHGLTPEATMYAQIITEINRRKKRGEQPRFVMHGKGMVGLAIWEGQGLAGLIEEHNRNIRKELLKKVQELSPAEFEKLVALLLAALGFEDVIVTPYSGDKGIDVRGTLVVGESIHTQMAVQVKKWKTGHNIQAPIVQQVRGSLSTHEQGLIITTSDFSKGAQEEAQKSDKIPVALMNGEQLVDLLIENNIGVERTPYELIEIGEIEA